MPRPKLQKTSVMNDPKPTGLAGKFQDEWEKQREDVVKAKKTGTTKEAYLNFQMALMAMIKDVGKTPIPVPDGALPLWTMFLSYERTDRNATNDKWLDKEMERLGYDKGLLINELMKKEGVVIVQRGYKNTGFLEYEDGSIGVISPHGGMAIDSSRKVVKIGSADTMYIVLIKKPAGCPDPLSS